jgi:hypothetical protein
MKCRACGAPIAALVSFCNTCGADLRSADAKKQSIKEPSKRSIMATTVVIYGLMAAIAVSALLGALYFLIRFIKWAWYS